MHEPKHFLDFPARRKGISVRVAWLSFEQKVGQGLTACGEFIDGARLAQEMPSRRKRGPTLTCAMAMAAALMMMKTPTAQMVVMKRWTKSPLPMFAVYLNNY